MIILASDPEIFSKTEKMILRTIGDETILMPAEKSPDSSDYIYTLNETGTAVYTLLDGKNTISDIMSSLLKEYEVPEEKLRVQVNELIDDLLSIDAIKHCI